MNRAEGGSENFDYAGLQADLDELEQTDPDVKAAAEKYARAMQDIGDKRDRDRIRDEVRTDPHDPSPPKLAVDGAGYCWRVYAEHWSMARINPDNEPIPEPVTFYLPASRFQALEAVAEAARDLFDSGAIAVDVKEWGRDEYEKFERLRTAITSWEDRQVMPS